MARVFGWKNLDSRVFCFCGFLFSPSFAQEVPKEILGGLASEKFAEREAAHGKLKEWAGAKAVSLKALYKQASTADDPEVQVRCLAVLKELVIEKEFPGEGYLGISMFEMTAQIPDEKLPRRVIRIGMVLPGTAAEKAGLIANDLIIGLGDMVWREDGMSTDFARRIRDTRPGTEITLVVLQGDKVVRMKVKPGLKPEDPGEEGAADARAARERFFEKWLNKQQAAER